MSTELGRVEDLPADYFNGLVNRNLMPLWPSLRGALPFGKPNRSTLPTLWRYADVRPQLMRAGELTPMEKAERRVLVLCNPGLGLENLKATPTIYIGLQLILPGESAPTHKHTPSAVRFVIEGSGGYTVVRGEKLPMEKGDLILTPPGLWHEHGHEGSGPVVWLDALDLPVVLGMEASYCTDGNGSQTITDPKNSGTVRFRQGGVMPYKSLQRVREDYPLLRFPWHEVKQTLGELASVTPANEAVHLAYINPETGQECMPTLGFSALMLRPGEELRLPRRSASAVFHVVEGEGTALIDGVSQKFTEADTLAAPTHAEITLVNASGKSPTYLFMVDDAPLHRKLGFYEVFN
ncbi:MAG: cupin domain-containing protein [Steroidobacteraceae bacterium]